MQANRAEYEKNDQGATSHTPQHPLGQNTKALPLDSASPTALMAGKSLEWLVLLALIAASIPPNLIRRQSLTVIPWLNIVDGSWILDTCYKAANGVWLGRDVAYTRGPLYQWLSSAPSLLMGPSLGSIYATSHTLLFILMVVADFLIARLLLPNAGAFSRAVFVLLAVVFWSDSDLRISFWLLAFAIFLRLLNAPTSTKSLLVWRAMAAGMICIAAFLYSADTGFFTAAALLLCSLATMIVCRETLGVARFLFLACVSFAAGVVLTNAFMGSALSFRFWRTSLEMVSAHRWFVPLAMDKADTRLVLETMILAVVVFGAAWWRRDQEGPWTQRPVFLLAAFPFAVLTMQSGLARSDHSHVLTGICTTLILCGAIAFDEHEWQPVPRWAPPALAVVLTLVFAHAEVQFLPSYVSEQARHLVKPLLVCPNGWEEFDHACIPQVQADIFGMLARYVDRNVPPDRPIVVFPYETIVGLTSHRDVAGGVMQSFHANGDYLTQLELEGLERRNPLFGLYFPDGILGSALDSVPSFTRSPELWFYLIGHFRGEASPLPGAVGLVTDDTRAARLTFAGTSIAEPSGSVAVAGEGAAIRLGPVHWPTTGADFVKLRLRVEYPPWWRIRKPSAIALNISFNDGTKKTIAFVVQPNHTSDVWFYPWDDRSMVGYFSPNPALWKLGTRASLTDITLTIVPFDWISVFPKSVTIQSIDAIRLGMN